jgi:hypothetical protein
MKRKNSEGTFEYGIYEVYYDENGKVSSWTQESLTPVCSSSNDLEYEMKFMMEAFKNDTLEYIEEK